MKNFIVTTGISLYDNNENYVAYRTRFFIIYKRFGVNSLVKNCLHFNTLNAVLEANKICLHSSFCFNLYIVIV